MILLINDSNGAVTFYPNSEPSHREGFSIVEADEATIAMIGEGGPFVWVDGVLEQAPAPPAPVPFALTAWQAKAALGMTPHPEAGTFLVAAEAAIAAMPDGPEKVVVMSAWNNNANFERASPTILSFGAALGMSSDDLDNLFRLGGGLVV